MKAQIIYLTGFMGSGKTTIGEGLGKALGVTVVDTDKWIEEKEGKAIRELFSEKGEGFFRDLETLALQSITQTPLIITTGGGIILREDNVSIMKEKGIVINLKCDVEEVFQRLAGDQSRPLLQNKNKKEIRTMYLERKKHYEQSADVIFDTSGKSIRKIIQELKEYLLKK
ncbi:shikimate kinase [Bacillus sp. TS-2]|nr:shikimate kinase [Bacillus sp. TS-2]